MSSRSIVGTLNHLLYLLISAAFAIGVGQSLFRSGRPFLIECFRAEQTADAVNRLFLVGFYLLNFAFVCGVLRFGKTSGTFDGMIETLGSRVGAVALVMGVMHFNNLYWCERIHRAFGFGGWSS